MRALVTILAAALVLLSSCGPGVLTWSLSGYGVNSTLTWDTRCQAERNLPANAPEPAACEIPPATP